MQGESNSCHVYTATEARKNFSDICDAAYFGQRVVIEKRDRRVALVSFELLERIDALLELEARLEAQEALTEFHQQGGKTMEELEQELDMD